MFNNLWYWAGDYDASYGSIWGAQGCSLGYSWGYYKNPRPARLGNDADALGTPRWYGSEDPFMNEPGQDYRIKPASQFVGVSPIGKALDVGWPYNVDANGIRHNNIGAYATVSEGTPEPTPVPTPTPTPVPTPPPTLVPTPPVIMRSLTISSSRVYESGPSVAVSAPDPAPGYVFDRWSGDINVLTNFLEPNTSALIPESTNVSISAEYLPNPNPRR
jgi:hypothetical protein